MKKWQKRISEILGKASNPLKATLSLTRHRVLAAPRRSREARLKLIQIIVMTSIKTLEYSSKCFKCKIGK